MDPTYDMSFETFERLADFVQRPDPITMLTLCCGFASDQLEFIAGVVSLLCVVTGREVTRSRSEPTIVILRTTPCLEVPPPTNTEPVAIHVTDSGVSVTWGAYVSSNRKPHEYDPARLGKAYAKARRQTSPHARSTFDQFWVALRLAKHLEFPYNPPALEKIVHQTMDHVTEDDEWTEDDVEPAAADEPPGKRMQLDVFRMGVAMAIELLQTLEPTSKNAELAWTVRGMLLERE